MARTRKLSPERKAFINGLIEHYHPEDAQDVQEMLKDLLGDTLQGMLEAEMDEKLGYSKYDYKNKETDDSRNGYSKKTVVSSLGEINLDIPRDRKGEFEPQAIKKNQTIKKAVYVAIGIKLNGNKEVLGMWIGGNDSAKYWLGALKYSHAVAFLTAFTVFSHSSSIVKFLILLINVAIFFPIGFIQCSPTVSRPIMQSNAFKTGAAVQSTSCPSMAMIWQVFSNSSFPYHRAIISAATFGYA